MDPQELAGSYIAGRAAAAIGEPATSNPHGDWDHGVAWAAGWHGMDFHEYATAGIGDLVAQNRVLTGSSRKLGRAAHRWSKTVPLL